MRLAVHPSGPVLDRLELHALAEDLRDRVDVVEGRERRAHDQPAAPPGPAPPPGWIRPRGGHVAIEHVHAAPPERLGDRAEVVEEVLVGEQVPLRILHADRGVDPRPELEVGHIADDQIGVKAGGAGPLPEKLDVLGREVEAGHPIAARGQPE